MIITTDFIASNVVINFQSSPFSNDMSCKEELLELLLKYIKQKIDINNITCITTIFKSNCKS